MQDPATIRKRPAPGTSPLAQQQQQTMPQQPYPYPQLPDNADFNNLNFSTPLPTDPSAFDTHNLPYGLNPSQPPPYANNLAHPVPSTELVRRTRDQQLAPPNGQQEQWNGFGGVNSPMDEEDEQDLDLKVALAKKDAQGKRKQIPPFVQKLSSFLDSNNTDLIRWSDDGRSFIVLDEDEFARTLIPELFKHNNYASFVRQLNMYGFHKTVNITDGSLRQSEKARKGVKPPSMYSHPYFRKNRPDLLWLIQKPAGSSSKSTKRKRDGNMKDPYDSDEGSPVPEIGGPPQQLSAPSTSQDLTQLPRNELAAVRRELQNLQTQQKFISQMITQLKEQNDQFYRQATAFQALHDRHENSINAILTFLATFYNRSLESPGAQNLVNMFTNAMPQSQQQHGSVVEEYNDAGTPVTPSNQVQRLIKRPPLLLPGPASNTAAQNLQPGSAVTEPSSARASVTPPNEISKRGSISSAPPESAQSMTSPAMKSDATTPTNVLNQLPESNDQMMNLINNVNASTNPQASTPNTAVAPAAVDMSSIVDRITQNNSPLTPRQREDMVASLSQNTNNNNGAARGALTAYNSANPAEFKERIGESQHTLDYLQQLQKRQDEKVQELNRRLQPLSPTGTIPGLHDISNQDPFDSLGAPGEYDPAAFINFDDPAPWDTDANADDLAAGAGGEDGDFDFGFGDGNASWGDFDGGGDMFGTANDERLAPRYGADDGDGGRVESVSSEGTSPAGTSMQQDEPGTPSKRVRSQ